MKKSLKKTIAYLRQFVGYEIIRTKPTTNVVDWSYTDEPVIFVGLTQNGCIKYIDPKLDECMKCIDPRSDDTVRILPLNFTDRNWITFKKASKPKGNPLNKWRGKRVVRKCPTCCGDESFLRNDIVGDEQILISASKYHIILEDKFLGKIICDSRYNNPNDWELA